MAGLETSISGFLNVDKPPGWTSSDIVVKLRTAFGLRKRKIKIGHGGTLDPMATGVLPICIGGATRLTRFVFSGSKSYRMTAQLGIETDSYDSEGVVAQKRDSSNVTHADIESILDEFTGEIDQVPPMYSALKRDGKPLYQLARQGKTIPREPRRISVPELRLTAWKPPSFSLLIECGSGFYARSLAHDIGQRIGCGAHMTSLRRERVGEFRIKDAVALESLLSTTEGDRWTQFLLPADHVLTELSSVVLDEDAASAFVHGRAVRSAVDDSDKQLRVYSSDHYLLGIGGIEGSDGLLHPKIVLMQQNAKVCKPA